MDKVFTWVKSPVTTVFGTIVTGTLGTDFSVLEKDTFEIFQQRDLRALKEAFTFQVQEKTPAEIEP